MTSTTERPNTEPLRPRTQDDTLTNLRSWHSGNRNALAALVAENLAWVTDHVHRTIPTARLADDDSADFVAETMRGVLEYGPQFEVPDRARFRALVARIVENDLRDHHRYLHCAHREVARDKLTSNDRTVVGLDRNADSDGSGNRDKQRAMLSLALDLLEPEDREVIRMRDWEGLTFAEAGRRLGLSEDGARTRYRRALPKIAQKVAQLRAGEIAQAVSRSA